MVKMQGEKVKIVRGKHQKFRGKRSIIHLKDGRGNTGHGHTARISDTPATALISSYLIAINCFGGSYCFSTSTQKQGEHPSCPRKARKGREFSASTQGKQHWNNGNKTLDTYTKSPFLTGVLQLFHLPKKRGKILNP